MIQSFKDRQTEAVFLGASPKGFPADLLRRARRKLQVLDAATDVTDLRDPPGNRLHQLTDNREGQWSISVNDQFRICFVWGASGPEWSSSTTTETNREVMGLSFTPQARAWRPS